MSKNTHKRMPKTNAMRALTTAHIPFDTRYYDATHEDISTGIGIRIAESLGLDPARSFKTLVCVADDGEHITCCVPVDKEIDLKRAARAVHKKSLSMIHTKELEALTGYIRGGVSPIGMKKQFKTLIDASALNFPDVSFSGGKRGVSVVLQAQALTAILDVIFEDITSSQS